MNTKLFGAFNAEFIVQEAQIFDYYSVIQTDKNYFILNPDFSFTTDVTSVNIIGKVFDLKETLGTLQIDTSIKNPAEAFLIAIERFGVESIKKFYGEFTFVFVSPKQTIIGRDLMGGGVPVFYNHKFFSDKIDSFKRLKGFSFDVDLESMMTFLNLSHIPSPKTAIKDISVLAPGDYLIYENKTLITATFYDFNDLKNSFHKSNISIDEAVEEYERLVKKSIKRRIEGSKKIGVLLSGGFDSASIVHSVRSIYDGEIDGLTIGFNGHPLSETPQAKALADAYKINYHETNLLGHELNELPGIVSYMDNPYLHVFYVSQILEKLLKVFHQFKMHCNLEENV
jgi:asparagine synthetase B (glutamine-hydrolysing)